MENLVRKGITKLIEENKGVIQIAIKQKAKFEGWLKFELANLLDKRGARSVEVEALKSHSSFRYDISFFYDDEPFWLEIKTPNTNWEIDGVKSTTRPITKNIQSIVDDVEKLNSESGIIAFVLFPVPNEDKRWEKYLHRISDNTGIDLSVDENCEIVTVNHTENNCCDLIVCTFRAQQIRKSFFS